ncbi:MAG: YdeI/OmpD-associated family protein [Polyangiales bacterium]
MPASPKPSRAVPKAEELPVLELADVSAWLGWLAQHHGSSRGVWIKLAKKQARSQGTSAFSYEQAVDGALCWGWIDGQKRTFDERAWLLKFTPRAARSLWSKINRKKALALIARGDMRAPGLAEVERAQRDGRWDAAYDSPREMKLPDDFAAALALQPKAAEFFAKLNAANRYAILWQLQTAKREDTRRKRILLSIAMLARRESA